MALDPDYEKRIHRYHKKAPTDFDPLTATTDQLDELRLPARPPADQTDAHSFWTELFSAPLNFLDPTFEFDSPRAILEAREELSSGTPAAAQPRRGFSNPARYERSRNWSGSFIKARRPFRFTGVGAAWTVPTISLPNVLPINPAPGVPERDEYRSSIWVGLNGYRSYPHMTMPQIGTWQRLKQTATGTELDIAAWWQWWSRDEVMPIVKFTNLTIKAGQRVLAGLVVVSNDEVVFFIKNQSTGDFAWVMVQAPHASEPLGMTAEWIVERPTTPGFIWPWRMPKFDDVIMDRCHAFSATTFAGLPNVNGLERARFIRMQERFPTPYRSAYIAVPDRLDAGRLRVRHREG